MEKITILWCQTKKEYMQIERKDEKTQFATKGPTKLYHNYSSYA